MKIIQKPVIRKFKNLSNYGDVLIEAIEKQKLAEINSPEIDDKPLPIDTRSNDEIAKEEAHHERMTKLCWG